MSGDKASFPFISLPLSDERNGIADGVCCAAMSSPGVSDEEQYRSLRQTGSLPSWT